MAPTSWSRGAAGRSRGSPASPARTRSRNSLDAVSSHRRHDHAASSARASSHAARSLISSASSDADALLRHLGARQARRHRRRLRAGRRHVGHAAPGRLEHPRLSRRPGRTRSRTARRRLGASAYGTALEDFEVTQAQLLLVGIDEPLARQAGDLAEEFKLRGYDAVQLASALALGAATTLVTWDNDLGRAAIARGCGVAPSPESRRRRWRPGASPCSRPITRKGLRHPPSPGGWLICSGSPDICVLSHRTCERREGLAATPASGPLPTTPGP